MNAHIVKSACLAAIAASLATSSPAWAEDVKGSKDHPALTRFEGAEIRAYEHKDFDEAVMPDRPIPREAEAKGLELEGKLTRISYRIDGKKSALEVYRNYQGALQAGGFKTLFECKGDEQCGGDFQSFVINGGKVRQPGQGDATFGGKYYVVLAKSAHRRHLRVPGRDGRRLQPHHAGVPAGARNQADANGQVQVLDMAAMQKSLAESGRVAIYGVYFDTDKAVVKPESKAALDEMGKLLNANPNLKVYVVGHTDNQGTLAGNMDLSQKRADAVVKALEAGYRSRPRACRRAAWRRWRRWPPTTPRPAAAKPVTTATEAGQPVTTRHRGIDPPEPRGSDGPRGAGSGRQQLAQHEGQDAAVLVVVHLDRRVDAQQHGHVLLGTVLAGDRQRHVLHRLDAVFQAGDVVGFLAGDAQRLHAVVALELQRQHAHADQVAAVDALEAAGDHGLHAQQLGALGGPVARRAGAVLSPPNTTVGVPAATYFMAAS